MDGSACKWHLSSYQLHKLCHVIRVALKGYFMKWNAVLNNTNVGVSRTNRVWLLPPPHILVSPALIWSRFEVKSASAHLWNTKAAGRFSSRHRSRPELLQWKLPLVPKGGLIVSSKYTLASWQKTRLLLLSGDPTLSYLSTSDTWRFHMDTTTKTFPPFLVQHEQHCSHEELFLWPRQSCDLWV